MRILWVGVIVGLVVASACGTSDAPSSTVETAPVVTTTVATDVSSTDAAAGTVEPVATEPIAPEPSASEPSAPATNTPTLVDVKLYLLRNEQLATVHRDVAGPAVLRETLVALLAGPTAAELASGLHSEVPGETELLDVALADGTATVDVSSEFESGGGSLSMTARVAQVVFTATQFDNVERVLFLMDGAPIEFLGGEGLVLVDPQTRSSVDRAFTGGIIIDTPVPGDTVGSPFTVTGEGDVFEADFPIEIRANGERIGGVAPVMAGAWGDWADFETTITLDAPPGPIELIAFDAGGCGDAPECPPITYTVVPLTFTG
jgi:germination protein M